MRLHVAKWTGAAKGGGALWFDHGAFGWRLVSLTKRGRLRVDIDNMRQIVAHFRFPARERARREQRRRA